MSHNSRIALQLRQGAAAGNRQSSFRSNVGLGGVESEKMYESYQGKVVVGLVIRMQLICYQRSKGKWALKLLK